MSFEEKLTETMAFGTSSYMKLDDLRMLYYGRRDIYVSFTDDGDQNIQASEREIDRPDSIVCYKINDVIGRRVSTREFYANVFRLNPNKGKFISDISFYTNDDLESDLTDLGLSYFSKSDVLDQVTRMITSSARVRSPFERLWTITEFFSKEISSNYGKTWREMLMGLGYTGFSDPKSTGIFTGDRSPTTIYLDYGSRVDLDILPIQKFRRDPRKRIQQRINRLVKRMAPRRNSVAKSRTRTNDKKASRSQSFSQTLRAFQDLL